MKAKVMIIGSLLVSVVAFEGMAQRAENDDMYFNSKDREKKLKGEKADASVIDKNDKIDSDYNAFRKKHFDKNESETEVVEKTENPTDSYSARTINPEYISRSKAEESSEDEQNYYVEGYVPANTYDSYSASNYNNNWNYNNGYGNYAYGSPYSSLYNPYSVSCNPWMSPYYSGAPGWTLSMGYMWGSPGWNSGWNYGMSYGWGSSYYNPYNYYPSYYSPYYYSSPYYNGYSYPTYYYGSNEPSKTNYAKRPSRHSAIVTPTPRSSERVTTNATTSGGSNGRTRQPVDEYYVKPFKRTTTTDGYVNPASGSSRERYSRPTTSEYPASRTRDSYSSPTRETRDSRSSYSTPSRSSSPDFSTPSRSTSSGGSGGSSPAPRKRD